jgi:hypothetical protein
MRLNALGGRGDYVFVIHEARHGRGKKWVDGRKLQYGAGMGQAVGRNVVGRAVCSVLRAYYLYSPVRSNRLYSVLLSYRPLLSHSGGRGEVGHERIICPSPFAPSAFGGVRNEG